MADFVVGEMRTAHANYVDVNGAPADVQGEGTWTVEPPDVVAFVPGADRLAIGVSMLKAAVGFVITASYDVDLRDGAEFVKALPIQSDPNNIIVPGATGGNITLT